jgi:hypothetical protein
VRLAESVRYVTYQSPSGDVMRRSRKLTALRPVTVGCFLAGLALVIATAAAPTAHAAVTPKANDLITVTLNGVEHRVPSTTAKKLHTNPWTLTNAELASQGIGPGIHPSGTVSPTLTATPPPPSRFAILSVSNRCTTDHTVCLNIGGSGNTVKYWDSIYTHTYPGESCVYALNFWRNGAFMNTSGTSCGWDVYKWYTNWTPANQYFLSGSAWTYYHYYDEGDGANGVSRQATFTIHS